MTRIEGVELLGERSDPLGRRGITFSLVFAPFAFVFILRILIALLDNIFSRRGCEAEVAPGAALCGSPAGFTRFWNR
jgi:hypothetical protein